MGVDARMYFTTEATLSAEALRDLGFRMAEAVGSKNFWHFPYIGKDSERGRGCLTREKAPHGVDPAATVVEVHLLGRYYGEGYERGDPWVYLACAEWIERNVEGASVYYGDDCGEGVDPFGKEEREAMIAHWARVGGTPYYRQDGMGDGFVPAPFWPVSKAYGKRMNRNGAGGGYAGFYCSASGEHQAWRDGQWLPQGKSGPFHENIDGDPWNGQGEPPATKML